MARAGHYRFRGRRATGARSFFAREAGPTRTLAVTQSALPVTHHGSADFTLSPILRGAHDLHTAWIHLAPGGVIGRHEASSEQLLLITSGDAEVSGADGQPKRRSPGEAALFLAGELHETRSAQGMDAVVIEGAGLVAALR